MSTNNLPCSSVIISELSIGLSTTVEETLGVVGVIPSESSPSVFTVYVTYSPLLVSNAVIDCISPLELNTIDFILLPIFTKSPVVLGSFSSYVASKLSFVTIGPQRCILGASKLLYSPVSSSLTRLPRSVIFPLRRKISTRASSKSWLTALAGRLDLSSYKAIFIFNSLIYKYTSAEYMDLSLLLFQSLQ